MFQMNLLIADWSSVLSSDNVVVAWEKFKSIFMSVVNQRTNGPVNAYLISCPSKA